jgi:hypothetical protein
MPVEAQGYTNGDDCFLAWSFPLTKSCRGFQITRTVTHANGKSFTGVLRNYEGFPKDKPKLYEARPSTEWPFQRYTWTDHSVNDGDTVTYTITPMIGPLEKPLPDIASGATVGPLTITPSGTATIAAGGAPAIAAVFNRGILLSQFITRKLPKPFTNDDVRTLVKSLDGMDAELRDFLMGPLGERLLKLLDDVATDLDLEIYAALYELSDDVLIGKLKAIKMRAHLVLSNGSDTPDGNASAAKSLDGVVDLQRRLLGSEGLGHNKFLVVCRKGKPISVWTGSLNWAVTGLCTQINNGILISDKALAADYLHQWNLLAADHHLDNKGKVRHFGPELVNSNDAPQSGGTGAKGHWTAWFTRTSGGQDLDAIADVINRAKKAILFLMFEPGKAGILQIIQARLSPASLTYDPDLYMHGVANSIRADQSTVAVTTVTAGKADSFDLTVVQPEGVRSGFGSWAKEITRAEFLKSSKNAQGQPGVVGYAITHSKAIVVDPFTDPVVITGSHNFSHRASTNNDENFLIIRGNKTLAERYIVNIMGVYQHYLWRAYLLQCAKNGTKPASGLAEDGSWQKKHILHERERGFWIDRK